MNRGIIITGVVLLVIVGGGVFISNQQSKSTEEAKMAQEKAAMMQKDKAMDDGKDEEMMKKDQNAMEKTEDDKMTADKNSSRYVEYSKAALNQAATHRRVLYFYANWCPICKPADADFKANSNKIPSDVTVIRVNYNDTDTDQEEKDLAKKYGITYQHTFVQIDPQGKEITKWNGGQTNELLVNIK